MSMQKICLILFLFGLYADHGYCAENQIKYIKVDNGLLTTVPGILVTTKRATFFESTERFYDGIIRKNAQFSLAELMNQNCAYMEANPIGTSFSTRLFLPTIVKIQDNNLINLGSFCKQTHKEAKEACRQNKALFYPFQQGVIVYGANQFDPNIFQEKKEDIEKMASENLKKKITAYVSLLYPLYIEPETKEASNNLPTDNKDMTKKVNTAITSFLKNIRLELGLD